MKYKLVLPTVFAAFVLAACGSSGDDASVKKETTTENAQVEKDGSTVVDGVKLNEPAKDEVCAFCNMKVHAKTDDMGAFTAQAVDDKGKNLFFDDAGCMLNYEMKHKVTLDKYVRNYDDKSWMKLDAAVVVKGDFDTPMKYGFAYFADKAAAEKFIGENKGSKIVDASAIDDAAHKKSQESEGHDDHDDHDDDSH